MKKEPIVVNVPDDLVFQNCPRCGDMTKYRVNVRNALSRHRDMYICPRCGTEEAFEDAGLIAKTVTWWCDSQEE